MHTIISVAIKSKEFIVADAMLTLVTYTLALSLIGQVLSAVQTSRTFSNAGTVKPLELVFIGIMRARSEVPISCA